MVNYVKIHTVLGSIEPQSVKELLDVNSTNNVYFV